MSCAAAVYNNPRLLPVKDLYDHWHLLSFTTPKSKQTGSTAAALRLDCGRQVAFGGCLRWAVIIFPQQQSAPARFPGPSTIAVRVRSRAPVLINT